MSWSGLGPSRSKSPLGDGESHCGEHQNAAAEFLMCLLALFGDHRVVFAAVLRQADGWVASAEQTVRFALANVLFYNDHGIKLCYRISALYRMGDDAETETSLATSTTKTSHGTLFFPAAIPLRQWGLRFFLDEHACHVRDVSADARVGRKGTWRPRRLLSSFEGAE